MCGAEGSRTTGLGCLDSPVAVMLPHVRDSEEEQEEEHTTVLSTSVLNPTGIAWSSLG